MAAGDTTLTITGNMVSDPELRYTPSGLAVATFRVASTPRYMDRSTSEWKDGESLFLSCNGSSGLFLPLQQVPESRVPARTGRSLLCYALH